MKTVRLTGEMIDCVTIGFGGLLVLATTDRVEIGQTRAGFAGHTTDGWAHRCHSGCTSPCTAYLFEAGAEFLAEMTARAQEQERRIRAMPTPKRASGLGGQLWEPCDRCGSEPSYMQSGGHLCAKCAHGDHPRIGGGGVTELENTDERSNVGTVGA